MFEMDGSKRSLRKKRKQKSLTTNKAVVNAVIRFNKVQIKVRREKIQRFKQSRSRKQREFEDQNAEFTKQELNKGLLEVCKGEAENKEIHSDVHMDREITWIETLRRVVDIKWKQQ